MIILATVSQKFTTFKIMKKFKNEKNYKFFQQMNYILLEPSIIAYKELRWAISKSYAAMPHLAFYYYSTSVFQLFLLLFNISNSAVIFQHQVFGKVMEFQH